MRIMPDYESIVSFISPPHLSDIIFSSSDTDRIPSFTNIYIILFPGFRSIPILSYHYINKAVLDTTLLYTLSLSHSTVLLLCSAVHYSIYFFFFCLSVVLSKEFMNSLCCLQLPYRI